MWESLPIEVFPILSCRYLSGRGCSGLSLSGGQVGPMVLYHFIWVRVCACLLVSVFVASLASRSPATRPCRWLLRFPC